MTREEAIKTLQLSSEVIMSSKYCVVSDVEAVVIAIETMRKYQKIEEIIDNWTKPEQIEWEIRKVLDNEKID